MPKIVETQFCSTHQLVKQEDENSLFKNKFKNFNRIKNFKKGKEKKKVFKLHKTPKAQERGIGL